MSEPIVSGATLAKLFGVDERTVRNLATRGIVIRSGRGKFDLPRSVQGYCAHLRETAAGRGGQAAVANLTAERAELAREQREGQAIRNARLRGELVDGRAVEHEWSSILSGVKAAMLAVPSRLQQRLPGLTAKDVSEIDREIRAALMEAGNAD